MSASARTTFKSGARQAEQVDVTTPSTPVHSAAAIARRSRPWRVRTAENIRSRRPRESGRHPPPSSTVVGPRWYCRTGPVGPWHSYGGPPARDRFRISFQSKDGPMQDRASRDGSPVRYRRRKLKVQRRGCRGIEAPSESKSKPAHQFDASQSKSALRQKTATTYHPAINGTSALTLIALSRIHR